MKAKKRFFISALMSVTMLYCCTVGKESADTPEILIGGISPVNGSPGTRVEITGGFSDQNLTHYMIEFGSVALPVFQGDSGTLVTLVPILKPGEVKVRVLNSGGMLSNSLPFFVLPLPEVSGQPGKVLSDVKAGTEEIITRVQDMLKYLFDEGIYTSEELNNFNDGFEKINFFLDAAGNDFDKFATNEEKTLIDGILISSGISELFTNSNETLPILPSSDWEYLKSSIFFKLDIMSAELSDIKVVMNLAGIACALGVISLTGTALLGSISYSIGILDNVIDGFIPTDLEYLKVNFQPMAGMILNPGDTAVGNFIGTFNTQSNPESSQLSIFFDTLFQFGGGDAIKKAYGPIAEKIAHLATSVGIKLDSAVFNFDESKKDWPFSQVDNVPVDIRLYSLDILDILGLIEFLPAAPVFSLISKFVHFESITHPVVLDNGEIAEYDADHNKLTAKKEGTTGYGISVFRFKPVSNGKWWIAKYLGLEWVKALDDNENNVEKEKITVSNVKDPTGRVNGLIKGFPSLALVTSAQVTFYDLYDLSGNVILRTVSDDKGIYSADLPAGYNRAVVSKDGYLDTEIYFDLYAEQTLTMDLSLLAEDKSPVTGSVSGTIKDATNGHPVQDARLELVKRIILDPDLVTDRVDIAYSSANGIYEFKFLEPGIYTAFISKRDFLPSRVTIGVVGSQEISGQDGIISPVLAEEDQARIVLTWGPNPQDLDAHLCVPKNSGAQWENISFTNEGSKDNFPYAVLDIDLIKGGGPETITINKWVPGKYKYYVHDNTNHEITEGIEELSNSGAQVKIFIRGSSSPVINIPPGNPGTMWRAFEMDGMTRNISLINTFTFVGDDWEGICNY